MADSPFEMIEVTIGHCVEPPFWDRVGHMIPEHNKIMQNTFWGGLGFNHHLMFFC